jgi:hypothetical protein
MVSSFSIEGMVAVSFIFGNKDIDTLLEIQPIDFNGYLAIFLEYPLTCTLFYNKLKSSLVSSKLMSEAFLKRKVSCLMLGLKEPHPSFEVVPSKIRKITLKG